VLESFGLRVSLAGALLVGVSTVALVFMPDLLPAIGMMIGGLAVIGGFLATLAHFYTQQPPADE
jgi:hypothetical protein